MKKVLKKMVGLLMAVMMIGSILVGSVSAAEVPKAAPAWHVMLNCIDDHYEEVDYAHCVDVDYEYYSELIEAYR